MTMIRKESAGDYQIGIWSVRRDGRKWLAQATGPGTVGDGSPPITYQIGIWSVRRDGEPMLYGDVIHTSRPFNKGRKFQLIQNW